MSYGLAVFHRSNLYFHIRNKPLLWTSPPAPAVNQERCQEHALRLGSLRCCMRPEKHCDKGCSWQSAALQITRSSSDFNKWVSLIRMKSRRQKMIKTLNSWYMTSQAIIAPALHMVLGNPKMLLGLLSGTEKTDLMHLRKQRKMEVSAHTDQCTWEIAYDVTIYRLVIVTWN